MYEGKIDRPQVSSGARDARDLRPLSWSELIARASAARQLCRVLLADQPGCSGSFAADAAERIGRYGHGIRHVNPIGLGHRKASESKDVAKAQHATTGDRGKQ